MDAILEFSKKVSWSFSLLRERAEIIASAFSGLFKRVEKKVEELDNDVQTVSAQIGGIRGDSHRQVGLLMRVVRGIGLAASTVSTAVIGSCATVVKTLEGLARRREKYTAGPHPDRWLRLLSWWSSGYWDDDPRTPSRDTKKEWGKEGAEELRSAVIRAREDMSKKDEEPFWKRLKTFAKRTFTLKGFLEARRKRRDAKNRYEILKFWLEHIVAVRGKDFEIICDADGYPLFKEDARQWVVKALGIWAGERTILGLPSELLVRAQRVWDKWQPIGEIVAEGLLFGLGIAGLGLLVPWSAAIRWVLVVAGAVTSLLYIKSVRYTEIELMTDVTTDLGYLGSKRPEGEDRWWESLDKLGDDRVISPLSDEEVRGIEMGLFAPARTAKDWSARMRKGLSQAGPEGAWKKLKDIFEELLKGKAEDKSLARLAVRVWGDSRLIVSRILWPAGKGGKPFIVIKVFIPLLVAGGLLGSAIEALPLGIILGAAAGFAAGSYFPPTKIHEEEVTLLNLIITSVIGGFVAMGGGNPGSTVVFGLLALVSFLLHERLYQGLEIENEPWYLKWSARIGFTLPVLIIGTLWSANAGLRTTEGVYLSLALMAGFVIYSVVDGIAGRYDKNRLSFAIAVTSIPLIFALLSGGRGFIDQLVGWNQKVEFLTPEEISWYYMQGQEAPYHVVKSDLQLWIEPKIEKALETKAGKWVRSQWVQLQDSRFWVALGLGGPRIGVSTGVEPTPTPTPTPIPIVPEPGVCKVRVWNTLPGDKYVQPKADPRLATQVYVVALDGKEINLTPAEGWWEIKGSSFEGMEIRAKLRDGNFNSIRTFDGAVPKVKLGTVVDVVQTYVRTQ